MKKILKYSYIWVLGTLMVAGLQSCISEDPFDSTEEGYLRIRTKVSSDLTRAAVSDQELGDKCVIYISSDRGLIRKYDGLQNVPAKISLKSGHYVAEAWTGDSVSASFDKKFYRGYQPFDIHNGENEVTLNCKIANVVVSVNQASLNVGISHLVLKVWNSRGDLSFTEDNIDQKGYFMMPNSDTDLYYKIEGEDISGKLIQKEGKIENVKRTHEYIFSLRANESNPLWGGAFFNVVIEEIPVIEDTVEIYGRPSIQGMDFSLENQVTEAKGSFTDKVVFFCGYRGIDRLSMKAVGNEELLSDIFSEVDLLNCEQATRNRLNEAGISWEIMNNVDENRDIPYTEIFLTFGASFLNSLPVADSEYSIELSVMDGQGKENTGLFRIANTEAAVVIEDPVVVEDVATSSDMMAITTTKANLKVTAYENAENPVLRYREQGASEWNEVVIGGTRSKSVEYNVSLSNLKASTTYEYLVADGEFVSDIHRFTTEGKFKIPNSSLEEWSDFADNNKVLIPGSGGQRSFWDSGNHGSATMSVTLTQNSTDMVHSGEYSARLRSQFVGIGSIGKFAAGNLFAGEYLETQGTDGRLQFGREYDGSHPEKLRFFANYRPGTVDSKGKGDYLAQGATDEAQVYVALSTAPVEIRTKKSDQKLFNPDDPEILAYGQVTWSGNIGADGVLEQIEIPLVYNDRARTNAPKYLIIVASASKYGDYFNGGEGSIMYLDDFELIY